MEKELLDILAEIRDGIAQIRADQRAANEVLSRHVSDAAIHQPLAPGLNGSN